MLACVFVCVCVNAFVCFVMHLEKGSSAASGAAAAEADQCEDLRMARPNIHHSRDQKRL